MRNKDKLNELGRIYGTYTQDGKTYVGSQYMELVRWVSDDDEAGYVEEWEAPGYDENGNEVLLILSFRKGADAEVNPVNPDWKSYGMRVVSTSAK